MSEQITRSEIHPFFEEDLTRAEAAAAAARIGFEVVTDSINQGELRGFVEGGAAVGRGNAVVRLTELAAGGTLGDFWSKLRDTPRESQPPIDPEKIKQKFIDEINKRWATHRDGKHVSTETPPNVQVINSPIFPQIGDQESAVAPDLASARARIEEASAYLLAVDPGTYLKVLNIERQILDEGTSNGDNNPVRFEPVSDDVAFVEGVDAALASERVPKVDPPIISRIKY